MSMSRFHSELAACLVAVTLALGCAGHRAPRIDGQPPEGGGADSAPAHTEDPVPPPDTTEVQIGKVRALSSALRPRPVTSLGQSAETLFPQLSAALAAAAAAPSADRYADVAEAYRAAGIGDKAYDYFARAVRLDPRSARSHDGLARLWRDWGFPHLAVPDAARAIFHAPGWATAHNTMGTIFQALGRGRQARAEFARAFELDPQAAYALSNVCYSWTLEGRPDTALPLCRQALEIDPSLSAAQNNLALAHASGGDLGAALAAFQESHDGAAASYNMGIIYLARRQFSEAAQSFAAAARLRPSLALARRRVQQAEQLEAADADPRTR